MNEDSLFLRSLETKAINPSEHELLSKHAKVIFKREGGSVSDTARSLFREGESQMDRIALCEGCLVEEYVNLSREEQRQFKQNGYRLF